MAQQQIVISPTMLAVFLAGAGAVWLLTRTKHNQHTAAPSDVSVPAATQPQTASLDIIKRMQEAEAAREAAWRRADKIRELRKEQATVYNEMKLVDSKLQAIDSNNIIPSDIIEAVKSEHVKFCQRSWGREGGIFGFGDPRKECNDLYGDGGRWQKRAEELHRQQKETLKTSLYAEKGKLQNDKKKIEDNLIALGEPIETPTFHRVT